VRKGIVFDVNAEDRARLAAIEPGFNLAIRFS
jgi:hypothetical protein